MRITLVAASMLILLNTAVAHAANTANTYVTVNNKSVALLNTPYKTTYANDTFLGKLILPTGGVFLISAQVQFQSTSTTTATQEVNCHFENSNGTIFGSANMNVGNLVGGLGTGTINFSQIYTIGNDVTVRLACAGINKGVANVVVTSAQMIATPVTGSLITQ